MRTNFCVPFLAILVSGSLLSEVRANQPVYARKAMVVAQEPLAADVGLAVMKSGGNAVDAAVAVGFALCVTYPFAGNIGGGGFMLVRMADGQTKFIDFRERAPGKATRDMYLDAAGKPTKTVWSDGARRVCRGPCAAWRRRGTCSAGRTQFRGRNC